eukprot:10466-Heterococcus_DN1.PRE.3
MLGMAIVARCSVAALSVVYDRAACVTAKACDSPSQEQLYFQSMLTVAAVVAVVAVVLAVNRLLVCAQADVH